MAAATPLPRPDSVPGTTYPGRCGSSRPPSQVPNIPGKGTPFRLTNFARKHSTQGFPHCARENRTKKGLHFRTTIRPRCPNPGILGNRISTCLLNQETDYHLIQLHLRHAARTSMEFH